VSREIRRDFCIGHERVSLSQTDPFVEGPWTKEVGVESVHRTLRP
jgi:hypothetical protein